MRIAFVVTVLVGLLLAAGCSSNTKSMPNAAANGGDATIASAAGNNSSNVNAGIGASGRGGIVMPTAGSLSPGNSGASGAAGNGTAGIAGKAGGAGVSSTAGSAAAGTGIAGTTSSAGGSGGASGAASAGIFKLTSPVVKEGELLPKEYRGQKPSPQLDWTAGPAGTKSYAVILKDMTPGFSMNYMHWVIYDIVPATTSTLAMGVPVGATITMPVVAKQAKNYNGMAGFIGPGAVSGTNMYRLTAYAVDVDALPGITSTSTGAQVESALEGSHKLASSAINFTSMP